LSDRLQYDAPVEPHRLLSVDPTDVEYVVGRRHPTFRKAGIVDGGDWDTVGNRVESNELDRR
jgi:hypothetical protein